MTTASKSVQLANLEDLQAILKPGDTVFTVLRHVSRSGMYRAIDLYVMRDNEPRRITWQAAQLLEGYDRRHEAAKASGCGMDMGFHLVYELSSRLYRDGFTCINIGNHGDDCPANDHVNNPNCDYLGYVHKDGGYALNQRWL